MNSKNTVQEFWPGARVTYQPFEKAFPAEVAAVERGGIFKKPGDDRVFYTLTGRDGVAVVVKCTGMCIKESNYFVEYGIDGKPCAVPKTTATATAPKEEKA